MKYFFSISILTILISPIWVSAYQPASHLPGTSSEVPNEIKDVGVTEHLGQKIDLSLEFMDETGQTVTLSKYFNSGKPVMMAMIYYSCPNLCNFQLNGTLDVVKKMNGQAGIDYEFVAVSMDHTETAKLAATKKENYMKALQQPGAEKGWHFLVGNEANVKALAQQLGFAFKWSDELKQFAHAAATYIVSPDGRISRYLYGIEFSPETLRLSLVEASNGQIGSFIEQFVLYCFQFNPAKNKYTLYAFNIMRIGAALMVLALAIFLIPVWLRQRDRKAFGA